jgi:hypothetical protein
MNTAIGLSCSFLHLPLSPLGVSNMTTIAPIRRYLISFLLKTLPLNRIMFVETQQLELQ